METIIAATVAATLHLLARVAYKVKKYSRRAIPLKTTIMIFSHVLWLLQKVKRQMSKDKWSFKKYLQNTQSQVNLDSSSQLTVVSTVKEQLEYIKKILSIGALAELVPTTPKKRLHLSSSNKAENACIFDELPSPPIKRLHISSSNKAENESIFEVSSPSVSASSQQSFQGSSNKFII